MNDKLKIIVEYDGWLIDQELSTNGDTWFKKPYDIAFIKKAEHELKYLTSLDWLHPVAMKLMEELDECAISNRILFACCKPPINGEYSRLFDAVVEGIIYLQNHSI